MARKADNSVRPRVARYEAPTLSPAPVRSTPGVAVLPRPPSSSPARAGLVELASGAKVLGSGGVDSRPGDGSDLAWLGAVVLHEP